jgi:hypothetical protein
MSEYHQLLEKSLQLANFIMPDRETAIQILGNAISKLKAQRTRENKRVYWRDKHLKSKITKIIRPDEDMLQWLIYFEAEKFEKQQELGEEAGVRDMVIRYVKHLVQISTSMSSFYVNLGVQRLLRNYTTAETRKIYERVTEHCPGAEEYRSIKATLMKRLEARFHNLITSYKTQSGEIRFELSEDQQQWRYLVDECLKVFTPWSTARFCPVSAGIGSPETTLVNHHGSVAEQDTVETCRCHLFIDPFCYNRIARNLGFETLFERLAVPKLAAARAGDNESQADLPRPCLPLTAEESKAIVGRIETEAVGRQQISPRSLTVLVDGIDRARLDLESTSSRCCEIQEGAKLVEVRVEEPGSDILFATLWLDYTEFRGLARGEFAVGLGGGRELLLRVVPRSAGATGEATTSDLWMRCERASPQRAWQRVFSDRVWHDGRMHCLCHTNL